MEFRAAGGRDCIWTVKVSLSALRVPQERHADPLRALHVFSAQPHRHQPHQRARARSLAGEPTPTSNIIEQDHSAFFRYHDLRPGAVINILKPLKFQLNPDEEAHRRVAPFSFAIQQDGNVAIIRVPHGTKVHSNIVQTNGDLFFRETVFSTDTGYRAYFTDVVVAL